jgi:autotransporter-associated beta strand protein
MVPTQKQNSSLVPVSTARGKRRRPDVGRAAGVAAASLLTTFLGASAARADLLSYYDFNYPGFGGGAQPANTVPSYPMSAVLGSGTLSYSAAAGGITNSTYFGGTALNNASSGGTADSAGSALSILGGAASGTPATYADNGAYLDFTLNTSGHNAPILTYETQRTSTGFNAQAFSYSVDGGNTFVPVITDTITATAFALQTIDFSSITALANASNVDIRMTFTGATSASGNNRLDNFQFNAGVVGGASGLLTYDPTATAGGTPSTAFTAASTVMNFVDSGTGKDVAFATGNTVNFTDLGITNSNGTVAVDAAGVAPGTINISNTTGTYTFTGGSIGGTGILTKSNAGTLVLQTSNTYSGGTTIIGGTVQVSADANLGTGGLTLGGGTLQTTAGFVSTKAVTLGAGVDTFDTGASTVSFTGNMSSAATATLVKVGTGNLTLNPFNTSVGTINVSAGSLTLDSTHGAVYLNAGTSATPSTIAGTLNLGTTSANPVELEPVAGATVNGTGKINVAPGSSIVQYASGTSNVSVASIALTSSGGVSPFLGAGTGANTGGTGRILNITSPLVDGAAGASGLTFGGTASVVQAFTGKVVVSGADTYSGGTTILAGTVVANNSSGSLGSGPITLGTLNGSSGILAGTGKINATVALASGTTITAGGGSLANDSIGVLHVSNTLTASTGSIFVPKLSGTASAIDATGTGLSGAAGTAADQLVVSSLGSTSGLTINPLVVTGTTYSAVGQYSYVILDDTGDGTGAGSTLATLLSSGAIAIGTSPTGQTDTLAVMGDGKGGEELLLDAAVTVAAPEPASLLLAGFAVAPLVLGRRRRRAAC